MSWGGGHVLARFPRRRQIRTIARGAASRANAAPKAPALRTEDLATTVRTAPLASTRRLRRGGLANVVVMTVAAGIVGTLAIPAYAFAPGSGGLQFGTSAETALTKAQAQTVEVTDDVIAAPLTKDSYAAVTGDEIRAAEEAAAAAEAARQAAEAQMASYAAGYSGPSASELAAAPVYGSADPASVFAVAQQYLGVPYVYGGATPAGFDCSGLVKYVYAQFGINLPHSSSAQGAAGTQISVSEAVPGDLVVMSGHIGFYAGNGNILHAPYEGTVVRTQPIWTSDYWIVRI